MVFLVWEVSTFLCYFFIVFEDKMKKVGIIGGGQLGMMLAESLKKKGAYVLALDPNPNCSCSFVCDEIIVGQYGDLDKLKELGDKSDVLTYEFENVPADKLIYLKNTYNIPPRLHLRRFALLPMCDLAHDMPHPLLGLTQREMLEKCADRTIVKPYVDKDH